MKAKKLIKGIAKTTGKYTLKGLGKGMELTGSRSRISRSSGFEICVW